MTFQCFGFLVFMQCYMPAPPVSDTYCRIARPVIVSHADTRATKEQADREYRKYKAVCGK